MLDRLRSAFRVLRFRPDVARELDEEIEYHLRRTVEELTRQGMSQEAAERAARARFGDVHRHRRTIERIDRGRWRMNRGSDWFDVTRQHVAFALRSSRRAPGFALTIVATLGLGIGANAVVFGVADRLLLSPPEHVRDADDVRLVYVQRRDGLDGGVETGAYLTFPDYVDLLSVDAFAGAAAFTTSLEQTLGRGEEAEIVRVALVTSTLFDVLGTNPALGRFFRAEEDAVGAPPVAVLSHEFWDRRFGLDPDVIGRTLELGDASYTVIGVAPPGFTGARLAPVDLWLPAQTANALESGAGWVDHRNWYWLNAVVRLAPGATEEAAAAQATARHLSGRAELVAAGEYDAQARIVLAPIIAARGPTPSNEARVSWWLLGVSLVVLLIACANVANLLLARSVRWRRELAVRSALGVSRGRLLAQLLTESAFLAGLGALSALVVAEVTGGIVRHTLLPDVAFAARSVSPRLLAFTALATLVTVAFAGLLPAWRASRPDVVQALKSDGGERRRRAGMRNALLIAQGTLSAILLVGAGLFVGSLREAGRLDLGYDAGRIVVARLQWTQSLPGDERARIYADALERLRGLPAVEYAALTYTVPFQSSVSLGTPRVPGLDSFPRHPAGGPYVNKVGSGFFETMGLQILDGRAFGPDEDAPAAAPVAVISRSMARAVWPRASAVGRCLIFADDGEEDVCTEVVGVVEDHRREALVEEDPHHLYYVNLHHPAFRGPPQALVLRTGGSVDAVTNAVRADLAAASPLVRFVNVAPMADNIAPHMRSWLLGASMFSVLGLLALVVASVGLYSVLAFDVEQRRRELGVRAALGASAGRLVRMVMRRALALTTVALALGLLLSSAAGPFVAPLLFQVEPNDPRVYGIVVAVLGGAALLAASIPSLRATRVDPGTSLRSE